MIKKFFGFLLRTLLITLAIILFLTPLSTLAVPPTDVGREEPSQQDQPQVSQPTTPEASQEKTEENKKVREKRQQVNKIEEEIRRLDQQLELAVEEYNAAREKLDTTKRKLREVERQLDEAELDFDLQKETLDQRLANIYKFGETNLFEIVLNARTLSDFFGRIGFLAFVSENDSRLLSRINQRRGDIDEFRLRLQELKLRQDQVEKLLEKKKDEVEKRLAERKAYLASVNYEIQKLLQVRNDTPSSEEASRIVIRYKSQLDALNLDTEPGSIVETAIRYLGVPYQWAADGRSPDGKFPIIPSLGVAAFDCSGFSQYVFKQHGVYLPHYSRAQAQMGTPVARKDLQPGDLIFFGNPIHHLGIYIGKGYFIHAPRTGDFVKISPLQGYPEYNRARRIPIND